MTTCCQVGCERRATHAAKIHVPALTHPVEYGTLYVILGGVELCELHALEFPARDQFYDENTRGYWRGIFDVMCEAWNKPCDCECDYDRAFAEAITLDSPEYLKYECAASGGVN